MITVKHAAWLLLPALVAGTVQAEDVFPLRVTSDGRLWRSQTKFACLPPLKASAHDMDVYLADREPRGLNALVTMAFTRGDGTYHRKVPNVIGGAPFLRLVMRMLRPEVGSHGNCATA